jgi:3-hydroxybutyryl-CoA dehydrogenase
VSSQESTGIGRLTTKGDKNMEHSGRSVAVVGAGLMGIGIATCLALAGQHVKVFDSDPGRRRDTSRLVQDILEEIEVSGRAVDIATAQARIEVCENLSGLADASIVYEAVVEKLEIKHAVYAQLEAVITPDAVIASNTSGFLPDMLCVRMQYPNRFVVAHFWNPPYVIPLVELVPATTTDGALPLRLQRELQQAGFEPIVLRAAIPGFIGNRIQFAVLREALHLVHSGVADAATVDAVVKSCLGRRYSQFGPLEVADLGGLDTFLDIATHLMPQLNKDESAPELLRSQIAQGNTGIDSGLGFYHWDEQRKQAAKLRRQAMLAANTVIVRAIEPTGDIA